MSNFASPICIQGEDTVEFATCTTPGGVAEAEDIAVMTDQLQSRHVVAFVHVGPYRRTARTPWLIDPERISTTGGITVIGYASAVPAPKPPSTADVFAHHLEMWKYRLDLANYQTIKRYMRSMLDDQELGAAGVYPSAESFSHFLDFFARNPDFRVSIMSLSDSGNFCTTWINHRKAMRVTLEFIRTGQVKWIYANREKKKMPIAGAGLQQPDVIPQILAAHSASDMVKGPAA